MRYNLSPKYIQRHVTPKIAELEGLYHNIRQGHWENYQQTQPKRDAFAAMNRYLKLCIEEFKKIQAVKKDQFIDFNAEIQSLNQTLALYQQLYESDDDKFITALNDYFCFSCKAAETARNRKIIYGLMLALGILGIIAVLLAAAIMPPLLLAASTTTAYFAAVLLPSVIVMLLGLSQSCRYHHSQFLPELMAESVNSAHPFFPQWNSLQDPELPLDSQALRDHPDAQYQQNPSRQYAAKFGA